MKFFDKYFIKKLWSKKLLKQTEKELTVPVTIGFSHDIKDQIGVIIIKKNKIFFNPKLCFELGLEKNKNNNYILKEISLVRKK